MTKDTWREEYIRLMDYHGMGAYTGRKELENFIQETIDKEVKEREEAISKSIKKYISYEAESHNSPYSERCYLVPETIVNRINNLK